jgi:ribosomal-protein-alanine N-acetyltransferase
MSNIEFRQMELVDIPAVVDVEYQSFPIPWTAAAFRNELTNNMLAKYMVLTINGVVAGYAGMWLIVDEAHVTNVAIHPDFRGQGLGEQLMHELGRVAAYMGMRAMTLEVRVSNVRAIRLYTKMGFEEAGVRKGYYSDNGEDALVMWRTF